MPANRNALIRYKTIDLCLQNKYRKWTLDNLIDACSEALYEYEGIDKGVSRRTVQADIQFMRSDKLGYNAPIIVEDKKYYTYEDPEYSITNSPITEQDLTRLNETVDFLKQFRGFSHFSELDSMVQKLEDHVYAQKTKSAPVIDFEKNENLKGLEYLDELYQAIIQEKALLLSYQSFKARQPGTFVFYPYLLKEFRNRWFILGAKKKNETLFTLALDRIQKINPSSEPYKRKPDFNSIDYFKDTIGVTVATNQAPEDVHLFITHKHAPYVLTKPFHASQELLERDNFGIVISLKVQHNYELEKEILGFGDGIKVIAPERLKRAIKNRLEGGMDLYNTDLNENGLVVASRKLEKNGFSTLNYVYSVREIKRLKRELDKVFSSDKQHSRGIDLNQGDMNKLHTIVFNRNLKRILSIISPELNLTGSYYKEYTNIDGWQQCNKADSQPVSEESRSNDCKLKLLIQLDDSSIHHGALQVVPGSHHKELNEKEIEIISNNCNPTLCEIHSGGILLLDPMLLVKASYYHQRKKGRVLELKFA